MALADQILKKLQLLATQMQYYRLCLLHNCWQIVICSVINF